MSAWLQLARIALLPTVVWDFHVGLLLGGAGWNASSVFALLALLSIYHGGMMLNDLCDVAVDREAGRARPLIDGRIRPLHAAMAILLVFLGALLLTEASGLRLRSAAAWLLGIVVLYDLSGATVRKVIGPALLAAARAFSLGFAVFALFDLQRGWEVLGIGPLVSYALFFLFVSRLAQREERGLPGLNGLAFLFMAAVAPAALFYDQETSWVFLPAWLLFAAYLLRPAIRIRHAFWDPRQVRSLVRHGLSSAPLVPGLILIADGRWASALLAIPVCLLVRLLARTWAPE